MVRKKQWLVPGGSATTSIPDLQTKKYAEKAISKLNGYG
jgi:hypothetical protein